VTSGLGYTEANDEFGQILEAVDVIRNLFPDMEVCGSLGILSAETAGLLTDHGLANYNHNLQVDPSLYGELVSTTHDVEDRIETLRLLKTHGVGICAGAIIGLGETMEDRVGLAFTLRDLGVGTIPLNVLIPIEGTPMEKAVLTPPLEVIKTFAIFRLVNPKAAIKFAAGRETVMKDWQAAVMLAGANGILTGGYLTTRGREIEEDNKLMTDLKAFR
jgi:biotin synthase